MKKILFSTALLAILSFAIFSSCSKEQVEVVEPQLMSVTETPAGIGPFTCAPVDRCSPNYWGIMETLFGPLGYPSPPGNYGEVDKILNCEPLTYCDPACESGIITLDFNGSNELPNVLIFSQNIQPPCTVAQQNQLIADVRALALQYAPTCPNSNQKYRVVRYDLYWDATSGLPGSYFLRALITYAPPCNKYSDH